MLQAIAVQGIRYPCSAIGTKTSWTANAASRLSPQVQVTLEPLLLIIPKSCGMLGVGSCSLIQLFCEYAPQLTGRLLVATHGIVVLCARFVDPCDRLGPSVVGAFVFVEQLLYGIRVLISFFPGIADHFQPRIRLHIGLLGAKTGAKLSIYDECGRLMFNVFVKSARVSEKV